MTHFYWVLMKECRSRDALLWSQLHIIGKETRVLVEERNFVFGFWNSLINHLKKEIFKKLPEAIFFWYIIDEVQFINGVNFLNEPEKHIF